MLYTYCVASAILPLKLKSQMLYIDVIYTVEVTRWVAIIKTLDSNNPAPICIYSRKEKKRKGNESATRPVPVNSWENTLQALGGA